jgi:hypothetical protein
MKKPKRPPNAYLLWFKHARDDIKKKHPGLKVTEIAKIAGIIWHGMKDKSESTYDITVGIIFYNHPPFIVRIFFKNSFNSSVSLLSERMADALMKNLKNFEL